MSIQSTINNLAILSQGRNPEFTEQAVSLDPPGSASAGVDLKNAVLAIVSVELREDPSVWAWRVRVGSFDTSSTHSWIVGGREFEVPNTLGKSKEDFLTQDLAPAIGADSRFSASYDSTNDYLVVTASDPFTLLPSSDGTDTFLNVVEPTWARFAIWARLKNTAHWSRVMIEGDVTRDQSIDGKYIENNWTDRLAIAGYDRLYVQVEDRDYSNMTIRIGPCLTS